MIPDRFLIKTCQAIYTHMSLNILNMLSFTPRYIIWWQLSDMSSEVICMCENMFKLISSSSHLEGDDRLKRQTNSTRWCKKCDLSEEAHVIRCVMRCPTFQESRVHMLEGTV